MSEEKKAPDVALGPTDGWGLVTSPDDPDIEAAKPPTKAISYADPIPLMPEAPVLKEADGFFIKPDSRQVVTENAVNKPYVREHPLDPPPPTFLRMEEDGSTTPLPPRPSPKEVEKAWGESTRMAWDKDKQEWRRVGDGGKAQMDPGPLTSETKTIKFPGTTREVTPDVDQAQQEQVIGEATREEIRAYIESHIREELYRKKVNWDQETLSKISRELFSELNLPLTGAAALSVHEDPKEPTMVKGILHVRSKISDPTLASFRRMWKKQSHPIQVWDFVEEGMPRQWLTNPHGFAEPVTAGREHEFYMERWWNYNRLEFEDRLVKMAAQIESITFEHMEREYTKRIQEIREETRAEFQKALDDEVARVQEKVEALEKSVVRALGKVREHENKEDGW